MGLLSNLRKKVPCTLIINVFAVVKSCLRIFIARTSSRRNMRVIIVETGEKCKGLFDREKLRPGSDPDLSTVERSDYDKHTKDRT